MKEYLVIIGKCTGKEYLRVTINNSMIIPRIGENVVIDSINMKVINVGHTYNEDGHIIVVITDF